MPVLHPTSNNNALYLSPLCVIRRSVDLLRSVLAAREAGAVYSIVFVGINGVGEPSYTLITLHKRACSSK
jgi:hypothetical protein